MGEQKRRSERMAPHDRAVQEVARKLTDEGRLIEAGWVGLAAVWLPADASAHQVADLRKAFMAGAQHAWSSFITMLEPGDDPTTADLLRMAKIQVELYAFGAELLRHHYPTRGSA